MLANPGPGIGLSEIKIFSFGLFSDITNVRFRQNYVLSCEALGFLSNYGLMFLYIQQFQSLSYIARICSI